MPNPAAAKRRNPTAVILSFVTITVLLVWAANEVLLRRPVAAVLDRDSRKSGFPLRARYNHYVQLSTLVLDLRRVERAAPGDLLRGTFSAAETLYQAGRRFDRVMLARSGTPVFLMTGEAFTSLGSSVAAGENTVYLVRTFPEHLYQPDGSPAFGTWTGGLLGVLGKQMEDVSKATNAWANGKP